MWIENSITMVTMVTLRHHKACQVMPNSYPKWQNFLFAPNNHYRFVFLHTLPLTIVFKLGCVLFYQFYAKISIVLIKKYSVQLISTTSWHHARGRLTPPDIRRKYPEWVNIAENLIGYARKSVLLDGPARYTSKIKNCFLNFFLSIYRQKIFSSR